MDKAVLEEKAKASIVQTTSSATEDPKAAAAPKINEFRNKFEKFGAPTSKVARKPSTGAPAAAGGAGTASTGNDAIDRASREARELAEQLQQQLTQVEQSRVTERQQLVDKLELRDAQLKTVNDSNAALEGKLRELSSVEQRLRDVEMTLEQERGQWLLDRTLLTSRLADTSSQSSAEASRGATDHVTASDNTSTQRSTVVVPIRKIGPGERRTGNDVSSYSSAPQTTTTDKFGPRLQTPAAATAANSSSAGKVTSGPRAIQINRIGRRAGAPNTS